MDSAGSSTQIFDFEIFVQEYIQHLSGKATVMVLDRAANHQKDTILKLLHLPKAAPELNPAEQFFKELRKMLSNYVFEDINQLIEQLQIHLQHYWENPQFVINCAFFPYIKNAIANRN